MLTHGISLYETPNYDDIHTDINNEIINDKVLVTTPTLVPSEEVTHISKIYEALI
jgi:hypothetical protein